MNIILLDKNDFNGHRDEVILSDRRFEHIKKILKSSTGVKLSVGLINDKLGEGEVVELTQSTARLKIDLSDPPPKALRCKLILALPRPIVLKRILASVTTLGIKEIYLIQTNRVQKSYWKSPVLESEQLEWCMKLGLEQAKDTVLPKVYLKKGFKPFVEDELPNIIKGTKAFFAHPENGAAPQKHNEPITLALGPEGGFVDYEIDKLKKVGFESVDLGERILKVETAVTAFISQMSEEGTS